MIRKFRAAAGTALLALATVVAVPSASAAIVTGRWDPALPSADFTNLGWTTTFNLKISNDCIEGPQSLPYIVNIFGRSFGCKSNPLASTSAFQILSAQAGIYDLTSHLIEDVLTFDAGAFTPFLLNVDSSGTISYLLSLTDSDIVAGGISRDDAYEFKLSLPGPAPAIKYRKIGTRRFTTAPDAPTQTDFMVNPDEDQAKVLDETRLIVGQRVFDAVPVPEPGSLALLALALGAAGIATARRRR